MYLSQYTLRQWDVIALLQQRPLLFHMREQNCHCSHIGQDSSIWLDAQVFTLHKLKSTSWELSVINLLSLRQATCGQWVMLAERLGGRAQMRTDFEFKLEFTSWSPPETLRELHCNVQNPPIKRNGFEIRMLVVLAQLWLMLHFESQCQEKKNKS